jgi:mannose-1-phosphate guanylyltransferase
MKIALLSGGSGKRLWPLSNDARSKQFLRMLMNERGEMESMVQRVWRQLQEAGLAGDACIATGKAQVDVLSSQLHGGIPIVVEPERRDTFPAIALLSTYLYSVAGTPLQEVVAVLPVDPYVEREFFGKVKELERLMDVSQADLALIGVKPAYPSEKYGYIVPKAKIASKGASGRGYEAVARFHEKPSEGEAERLIGQGALWNCGVFAFRLNYMIELLVRAGYPIQYDEMVKQYDRLPQISFDCEVVEKADNVIVTSYGGYWKDLGTWNTLTEEMSVRQIGKAICDRTENTHVINESDLLVAVIGVSNVVVAASPDGILVADKAASPKLKELLKNESQRPMFEERRWGTYKVLNRKTLDNGREAVTRLKRVRAGQSLSYHLHVSHQEYWTILSGSGEFVLNNKFSSVKEGQVLQIPAGSAHSVKAVTDLEWVEVQLGRRLAGEDTLRLFADWDDIVKHCRVN